jgi:hypothetical protein
MVRGRRWMGMALLVVGIGLAAAVWGIEEEILLLGRLGPPANPEQAPDTWRPLTFKNIAATTRYSIVRDGEHYVLKAESHASASGLLRSLDLDPQVYQIVTWRWKVENVLAKGDERRKEGDDYAARLFVTFQYTPEGAPVWERTRYAVYKLLYGTYPPERVINYIWANRLPKGEALASTYTARNAMIAVESGPEHLGRWMQEERNVYEDYRRLFGQEPPRIAGVALMTDTDNTGESAVDYYDDIRLRTVR